MITSAPRYPLELVRMGFIDMTNVVARDAVAMVVSSLLLKEAPGETLTMADLTVLCKPWGQSLSME